MWRTLDGAPPAHLGQQRRLEDLQLALLDRDDLGAWRGGSESGWCAVAAVETATLGAREQETPAVAHVLPLRRGQRADLVSNAAAAVFVHHAAAPPTLNPAALARLYDLTPAETRMLGELLSGDGLAEIARRLAISEATAKTHRTRIFAKTRVARRAELAALAWRLMPVLDS
jgi:DNA-binding CsgD family transcriptional regulator